MRVIFPRFALFSTLALACVAIAICLVKWQAVAVAEIEDRATGPATDLQGAFANLPLHFEANLGQGGADPGFLTHGPNYRMELSRDGATIALAGGDKSGRASTVSMEVAGSNKRSYPIAEELSEGKVNYFIGSDQSKWLTDIPTYKKVRYEDVYSGIDLVYYGKQTELEFDFVVAPGADPQQIKLDFTGADRIAKDDDGNLRISLGEGDVILQKPVLYQSTSSGREPVDGKFAMVDRDSVRFEIGDYDRSRELVIDPILSYSTFLPGGTIGWDIAVDADGNAIVTGSGFGIPATTSLTTGGIFVTKFNPTGSNLIFSSRVGTQGGSESGRALKVDPSGNIVVTGNTNSSQFPSINAVKGKSTFFVSSNGGDSWANPSNLEDFQVFQIAPSFQDANLVYAAASNRIYRSTNAGASWTNVTNNLPNSLYSVLAVHPSNSAQLLTYGSSGLYRSNDGGNSWSQVAGAVLQGMGVAGIQYDPTNGQIIYLASGTAVRKSIDGGQTWSTMNNGFPTTNFSLSSIAVDTIDPQTVFVGSTSQGVFKSFNGGANWVAVNSGMTGTGSNIIRKIAIDPNNSSTVFVATGNSSNPNLLFKSTNGGLTWTLAYTASGFGTQEISSIVVSRFDSAKVFLGILGRGFYRSTDAGAIFTRAHSGMVYNRVWSIAESPLTAGRIFVGTSLDTFINDAFIFKLAASGNSLIYSSLLGGSDNDSGLALAIDSEGSAYVGGTTKSLNFPTVNAFDSQHGSDGEQFVSEDGFVTKIAPNGGTMAYSTYLGGNSLDSVNALAVDGQGKLAITGSTQSPDFPLLNSHQPTLRGSDVFLTKLSPGGNSLEFSTFWGSTSADEGRGLGVDAQGNMIVAGRVTASGLQTVNAIQPQFNGGSYDGFITKFSSNGSQVVFSTHLGGKDIDTIEDLDIDPAGNIYVAGTSYSKDFPTVRSAKNPSTYYRSSTRAEKWSNFNDLRSDILDFAFHPTDPQIILGTSNDGLFRTADGGDTWMKVTSVPASLGGGFASVEFDPQNPSRIFIGFRDVGGFNPAKIALSPDGGATWNVLPGFNGGSGFIFKLVVSPANPQVIYAGTDFSLYKSLDGGTTWARATTNELGSIIDLSVNPTDPSIVYIARTNSGGGIHRTLDGGATWQLMPLGVGGADFVVIDPTQPSTVYAEGIQGGYKTVNNGVTWTPVQFPPTGFRLAVDPFNSNTLYLPVHPTATLASSGVFRSTDGGATWTKFMTGMPRSADFQRIEPDPRVEGTLHGNMALDTFNNQEAFVTKLSPSGSSIIFSSVIGGDVHTGSSTDFAMAVAAGPGGSAFLTGGTTSPDFPITPGAYSQAHNNTTMFVSRFDPSWTVKGRITDQQSGASLLGTTVTLISNTVTSTNDTDGLGKYVFPNVVASSSITVVPRKLGYDFTPANYTIGSLGQDETLNFTGAYTAYPLQGTVTLNGNPLPNATVTLSGSTSGSTTSDSSGNYSFMVPKYGDYSVRASLDGYIFTPQQHSFSNVTTSLQANFAARLGYSISGQILRNGNPVAGASVALSGSENQTVSTNAAGNYSFDAGLGGNYTVTPSAPGLGFTPISRSFTNLSSNQTGNFTAYRFESTIDRISFVARPVPVESQTDIFTIDDEGADLRRLTTTATTSESQPAWSPNGRKIAYLKSPSGPLWMMDYDGGNDHPVLTSVVQISSPDWSPDGSRITFHGQDPMSGLPKIFVVNADGTGVQMITSGSSWDENPNWSPDGSKIIFNRLDKLYTVNPDGTGLQILLNSTLGQSEADWSPTGQEIVFRGANGSSGRIYIVGANGTNLRRLTNEDREESSPAWSLDGTRIAYIRDISGNIYTRNTTGGDLKQITTGSDAKHSPAWRPPLQLPPVFDFDGDSKTDIGIFRPNVGEWWYQRSTDGHVPAFQFGASTDKIVPADYTGDGKTDVAIWRPESGDWYILRSEDLSYFSFPFGTAGDIPAPADYDGDGKADAAVFRPSTTTWYVRRSGDNGVTILTFGAAGDVPVVADYDGDAKADVAVYRPSNGQWWLNRTSSGVIAATFGTATDKPVPGEYTGDGKFDIAFWRPSTGEWFILRSEDSSYYSSPFGSNGDVPAPGDYDGDGKFDITVFRPSGATWFSQRTAAGTLIQQFGATGDLPIPSAFAP